MFCPNCGTKNEEGSLFCMTCGTPLREENSTPMQPESRVEQGYEQPRQEAPMQGNPYEQQPYGGGMGNGYQTPPPYQGQPYTGENGPRYQGGPYPNGVPNGSAGNPYRGPVYQNQQPPVREKKPVSRLAIVVGLEVVAAVALIAGTCKILGDRFSPEKAAMDYWKATAACEWSQAYDYCDFPESNLLTKEMYVEAKADETEPISYKSVKIKDAKQMAADQLNSLAAMLGADNSYSDAADEQKDEDLKAFVIEYMEKGADSKSSEYLTLTKTGKKKFLFWDEWKVASSDSWARNVTYTIPEHAALSLNGEPVDESGATVEDGWKTLTIPYLFTGRYQLEVTEDGMEPYCKYTVVTTDGHEEGYMDLMPSAETLAAVGEQSGKDIQYLIESALQGKSFKEVQDVFSTRVLESGDIKAYYEDMSSRIRSGGSMNITGLSLTNLKATLNNNPRGGIIDMRVTADMTENYLNYWNEPDESSGTVSFYATYEKEGDTWKLTNLPVDGYDF